MREIVQNGAPVLREIAEPVPESAFGGTELAELVDDMVVALEAEPDGVALAAPQVGVSWRLFVVRMDRVELPPLKDGAAEGEATPVREAEVEVYVNPEIVKTSRRRAKADEGRLSARGLYGTPSPHERVTLSAPRPSGELFTRGAGGLLAQIFEHEVDHLNGILFTDGAEDVVEIKPHHHEPVA